MPNDSELTDLEILDDVVDGEETPEEIDPETIVEGDPEKDDEEEDPKEDPEPEPEPEPSEDEDARTFTNRPTLKEIKSKYPTLFKDFPGIKDAIFREQAYNDVFPSIAEAKEAAEKAEVFTKFEGDLLSGDPARVLNVIHGADPRAAQGFINNFLPALSKLDKNAYFAVVSPVVEGIIRDTYAAGQRKGDENLTNTALQLIEFLGFDPNAVLNARPIQADPEVERQKQDLQNQQQKFFRERYEASLSRVSGQANTDLDKLTEEAIGKEKLTPLERTALKEKILKELDLQFAKDSKHQSLMASLWRKAEKSGFSGSSEQAILNAYISRAKTLLPSVSNQVKTKELGKRTTAPSSKPNFKPNPNTPNRETSANTSSKIGKNEIDWRKTSDDDILNGKVFRRK